MPFKVLFLKFAGPLLIYAQNFKLLSSRSFIKEEKEEKQKQVRTFFYLNVLSCFEHFDMKITYCACLGSQEKEGTASANWSTIYSCSWSFPIWGVSWGWNSTVQRRVSICYFSWLNFFDLLQLFLILFLRWNWN